jgi:hypothetical protein
LDDGLTRVFVPIGSAAVDARRQQPVNSTRSAPHTTLFDQAGMMVRADERNWLKTGLEVTSGAVHISTVYTREFSDVSMVPIPRRRGEVSMRVTRFAEALVVQCRSGDGPVAVVAPRPPRPARDRRRRRHVLLAGARRPGGHVPGLPDRAANLQRQPRVEHLNGLPHHTGATQASSLTGNADIGYLLRTDPGDTVYRSLDGLTWWPVKVRA